MSDINTLFCFGYGYCCDYLGHALSALDDWRISGTTREPEKRAQLEKRGIEAHIFDTNQRLARPASVLKDTTHLLISTPPDSKGDPVFLELSREILKLKNLRWVGYLSTTGVYGDRGGEWVDESADLNPAGERNERRVKAEQQWLSLAHEHGLPVHIFRLAGIYGPGRSALDSLRAGVARRIDKPNHVFNRIHVEDIVNVLLHSIERPQAGAIYNVCDDVPAPSHEVIAAACEILGHQVPPLVPFEEANLSPMARGFYGDNKRVRNGRIKDELGVNLRYKNFQEGLQACYEAEEYTLSIFKKSGA